MQTKSQRQYSKKKTKDPKYGIKNSLKHKHGLTLEQYDEMLEKQNGVCALCHTSEKGKNRWGGFRRLAVDHDHKTGEIRGLLCQNCNMGIGYFDDDPAILAEAIRYLLTR